MQLGSSLPDRYIIFFIDIELLYKEKHLLLQNTFVVFYFVHLDWWTNDGNLKWTLKKNTYSFLKTEKKRFNDTK